MELKTPLPQRPSKELVPEVKKKETPLVVVPTKKMTERESETPKMTSFEPSPQQKNMRKKKKEPTLDPSTKEEDAESSKELEEVESFGEEPESKEGAEPTTASLEKKKKIETWASEQKKPDSIFKTLVFLKRPMKTPKKEESSLKKLKKK